MACITFKKHVELACLFQPQYTTGLNVASKNSNDWSEERFGKFQIDATVCADNIIEESLTTQTSGNQCVAFDKASY